MTQYIRYYEGEWSALYVDGKIAKYGDHYIVDEWIATHLGVEDRYSNDFLKEDGRTVFPTLEEVHAKQEEREQREMEADELRQQAIELQKQAAALFVKADQVANSND